MLSPTIATLIFLLLGVPCVFPEDKSLLKHIINALKSELPHFILLSAFSSHFSLLLGCALPIWMSSGYNDRPLAPFAGILSLGIGDTMVSVFVVVCHYLGILVHIMAFQFILPFQ